ncbi:hypothetical protein ATCVTN60342_278L [Acanthocystis turfacea Chlorella virus TN603.4.2]|nr:hypothetical protein ATCVTN60342_278L [Acanthocystis turfacea Chlorella virus TN603.4.2]
MHLSFDPSMSHIDMPEYKTKCRVSTSSLLLNLYFYRHTDKQRNPRSNTLSQTISQTLKKKRMSVYTAKTFDAALIGFGPVEKNKMGGKFIPLTNASGTKTRFTIQTPTMHLPFGISAYRERPDAEPQSYSADLSFRGMDTDDNIATFYNKIQALDAHLLDAAVEKSVEWFGKKKSRELLEDTYRPLTKVDAAGKYAPNMKFKIALQNGAPNVRVFDTDKTPITVDDIPRGSKVKIIAEIASIWMVGGGTQWGVTFRAAQILVVSKPASLDQFAFTDDGDDDTPKTEAEFVDDDEAALKFL